MAKKKTKATPKKKPAKKKAVVAKAPEPPRPAPQRVPKVVKKPEQPKALPSAAVKVTLQARVADLTKNLENEYPPLVRRDQIPAILQKILDSL